MIPNIGKPVDRVDGRPKTTGSARYAAEHNLENAAYGVLVMSTIPAGTIRSIDANAALKSQGVLAVLSHLNAPKLNPPGREGNLRETYVPFSDATIHYTGQRIAVVVADTIEHATRGAELVKVAYVPAQPRIDMQKLRAEAVDRSKSAFSKGDADAAFAAAPVKIDETYRTPHEHHNPLEAHSIIAAWNGDHLTIYDSSQNIFGTRDAMAALFGIPKDNVHVTSQFVGGAFGSKGGSWPHVVISAIAARAVERPVKVVVTRKQLYFANGHRPETEQRVALGASPDGKLLALIHEGASQTNDVCDYAERFARPTRVIYASDSIRGANPVVSLNLPSPTYMRAPGENPGMFAIESAMDELAYALKMDPLQLRLVNHADADPVDGKPWSSKSLKQCYQQGAERFGWSRRKPEPRSMRNGRNLAGLGMASATYPTHRSPASARALMKRDGTVVVSSGSHEMGMGTATVMAQLAAETLGVPVERVRFEYGDTNLPQAPISAGSMTAASVGSAVHGAVMELKNRIAALDGVDPATLDANAYHSILAKHYLDQIDARFDAKPPQQESLAMHAFGAHFVEVSIDEEIPVVHVQRIVSAFAGGRILNEKTARSQYLGGIIQGLGMALMEETHLDKRLGSFVNVNFAEYLVPVNPDIPNIDVILIEEDDPHVNPIGVKGIGEIGIVGVAPAIANAVFHATGKRVRDLPITIEKLM
ncbi:MAG TPA: xanthine dehydrogenase family protein molybdopterin-binding subunit [Thermoanaerobaculia bacterium]|nr:xanthine dehydrogenase family protein molybdopterin-binding subunit [Thermoanaerobaculia bacterium]